MGEATQRLEVAALEEPGRQPIRIPNLKTIHLLYCIVAAVVTLAFSVGRSVVFKDDADRNYQSRPAYEADKAHFERSFNRIESGQIRMESKLDRALEIKAAVRP